MSVTIPRFAFRSAEAGHRLDLFLVCAVASVIGNRVFLIITGYPQLGNGTLHISHAIWGALMMAVAIIFSISFLAPNNRTYFVFITMYLVFRGIQRRDYSPDEAVLNGLEAVKSAAIGELSEARRTAAVA